MALRDTRPTLEWYENIEPFDLTPKGFYKGNYCLPKCLQKVEFSRGHHDLDISTTTWGKGRICLDPVNFSGVDFVSMETPNGLPSHLNTHKMIQVTSAIFVQFVYSVITDPDDNKNIALFTNPISPLFSIIDKESYTLKCLEPCQDDIDFLGSFSCTLEKEYLIKIGAGMYLGLTYEGVVIGTLQMFKDFMSERVRQVYELVLSYEITMINSYCCSHFRDNSKFMYDVLMSNCSVKIFQLREMRKKKNFKSVLVHDYFKNRIRHNMPQQNHNYKEHRMHTNFTPSDPISIKASHSLTICVGNDYCAPNKTHSSTNSLDSLGFNYNSPDTIVPQSGSGDPSEERQKPYFSDDYPDTVTL